MAVIPKSHPRYKSLVLRKRVSEAMKVGLVHETGLIAHGRGEAFDYLFGEKTSSIAFAAERVAAAALLYAKNPVISVNGNVVALVPKECIDLAEAVDAKLEVNLFHRTPGRIDKIVKELRGHGAKRVYGQVGDGRIPNLDHDRGICDKEGIFSSDVMLVPLEDGDRCQALKDMGKTVIVIDLNPFSRTAKAASITIVDNVIRAIPNITMHAEELKKNDKNKFKSVINSWDNEEKLGEILDFLSKRLNHLS